MEENASRKYKFYKICSLLFEEGTSVEIKDMDLLKEAFRT